MDGMSHDHDMSGIAGAMPPSSMNNGMHGMHMKKMMMHMTFFWGTHTEVLFDGWPGRRTGMYVVSLVFVFVLSFLVEWLSHSRLLKRGSINVPAGMFQTLLYAIRVGLSYLVMLALMSYNGGVFLVAVAGHAFGFLIFGSRVFNKPDHNAVKGFDPPPMTC
ncbi:copper transporter 6-like [Juglans regia]|uniref:Copper transport protein n=2 Tax=Juglans regia TaxID=51240 RepID=A0A2I4FFX1_JUGRE|nr:copper transporter 6-like [Juglans regia]